MKRSWLDEGKWMLLAGVACACMAQPARGQQIPETKQWFQRGTVMIGAQVGGAAFSDFQRSVARPITPSTDVAGYERRISASTSSSAGAWVAVWLSDRVGIRGGAAYAPSAFTVRNEESGTEALRQNTADLERQYAGLRVLLADATMLYRIPLTFGRVAPYALGGAGIVRYWRSSDGELPPEAKARFDGGAWTGAAAVLGVGAVVPLEKRDLMLVFEFTDHISRTPLRALASHEAVDVSGVQVRLDPSTGGGAGRVGLVNNVRLMVGLVLPLR